MKQSESRVALWAYGESPLDDTSSAILLDNVQFIYELALAELELQSLGARYRVINGLRRFELLDVDSSELLRKRVAYFKIIGGKYADYFHILRANRTRSVNQYLTHWIYPYKGKFHPQMIRALLNIIGLKSGNTVLDPFIGSGTTAVEAQLLGINCIGLDVSPLCVLQSRVKAESISVLSELEEVSKDILGEIRDGGESELSTAIDLIVNEKVRNFFKVAELIAYSDRARRRRQFLKSFVENMTRMLLSVKDYGDIIDRLTLVPGKVEIRGGDARDLPLSGQTIDGIITSPPYSIALDYVVNDAHALKALGHDPQEFREKFIGVRGRGPARVALYNNDMTQCFDQMARVLKSGRFCVIVIGNATYQGSEIPTVEFTIAECEKKGLKLVKNIDKIIFGLYSVMKREKILIFQKS